MTCRGNRGFTLVDLMVGLMVGLLVCVAAYGSAMFFETKRRTMSGGNGAMENAVASLFSIQKDARSAGIGLMANGVPVCTTINVYFNGSTQADGASLAPASISDGGAGSDTISFAYTASALGGAGMTVNQNMASAASPMRVATAVGLNNGDLVLAAAPGSGSPCTLIGVTGITGTSPSPVDLAHAAGAGAGRWNPTNPTTAFSAAQAYPASSLAFNAGPAFTWSRYSVANSKLMLTDLTGQSVPVELADNVVLLKAWYGTSNGTTAQIEQWTPGSGAWAAPLDAAHISALRAVRVVVVARAQQREKPSVAGGNCDATTAAPASWPGGPALDLSADPEWQCYRYRTASLVIPLKNLIFGGGV